MVSAIIVWDLKLSVLLKTCGIEFSFALILWNWGRFLLSPPRTPVPSTALFGNCEQCWNSVSLSFVVSWFWQLPEVRDKCYFGRGEGDENMEWNFGSKDSALGSRMESNCSHLLGTAVPACRSFQSFCLKKSILLDICYSRSSMSEVFQII